ncbi:hypothetical protein FLA_0756 [Filimonas lacunae]|nr:hypothetical protein FLA_0756 [Filimonas lacunae]
MIDILKKEAVNTNALLKIDSEYEFAYEEVMIAFQEQEDTRKTLKHALSHLTTKQKEAIRMRFFENKNYGEIALLSLCEQHTVYSHIYEAVARLRYFFKVKHTS